MVLVLAIVDRETRPCRVFLRSASLKSLFLDEKGLGNSNRARSSPPSFEKPGVEVEVDLDVRDDGCGAVCGPIDDL